MTNELTLLGGSWMVERKLRRPCCQVSDPRMLSGGTNETFAALFQDRYWLLSGYKSFLKEQIQVQSALCGTSDNFRYLPRNWKRMYSVCVHIDSA